MTKSTLLWVCPQGGGAPRNLNLDCVNAKSTKPGQAGMEWNGMECACELSVGGSLSDPRAGLFAFSLFAFRFSLFAFPFSLFSFFHPNPNP